MSNEQMVRFVYGKKEYEVPQQPDWDNQLIVLDDGTVVCSLETLDVSPKRPSRIAGTKKVIDAYTMAEPDTLDSVLATMNAVLATAVGPAPKLET